MARARVVTPKQERSADTLERVLAAAEAQIAVAGLAGLDLRRVCERAGVTTGAFYARFRKKEDLLDELLARFRDQNEAVMMGFVAAADDHRTARDVVRAFIATLGQVYRERGALIAALIEGSYGRHELRKRASAMLDAAAEVLALTLARVDGKERDAADVRFATYLVFGWFDQELYLGPVARRHGDDRRRLEAVVSAALTKE